MPPRHDLLDSYSWQENKKEKGLFEEMFYNISEIQLNMNVGFAEEAAI